MLWLQTLYRNIDATIVAVDDSIQL